MNALPIIVGALCVIAIAYRYYSAFIAAKVSRLTIRVRCVTDDVRRPPLLSHNNGFVGHTSRHFRGRGVDGPVGRAIRFLRVALAVIACVSRGAGTLHDLAASIGATEKRRRNRPHGISPLQASPRRGNSLHRRDRPRWMGWSWHAWESLRGELSGRLHDSPRGFMGLYMYRFRKGRIVEATIIGVVGLLLAVYLGGKIAESSWAEAFTLSPHKVTLLMAAYGFIASVLPVWMLLCPRDYLSSYLKVGTARSPHRVIVVHPTLHMPAITPFVHGGGPIVAGKVYPFVFITIACGAISGFHALISSGTTPKMIAKETDARMIGYGSMLMEGVVGVVALIAATSLFPGDYFAMNSPQATDAQKANYVRMIDERSSQDFNLQPQEIDRLEQESGEKNLRGRTGGAVTLAIGIAKIFDGIPGLRGLMKYWYHFAIMFEALFILTTIDTGTRVARFLVGEFGGRFYKRLEEPNWLPGSILTSAAVVSAWAAFIWTGSISTIWPMFGIANQLLAAVALCVATTVIINMGKARYAWVTIAPLAFVATTTLVAGYQSIRDIFWPQAQNPLTSTQGYINTSLTALIMTAAVIVLTDSIRKWIGGRSVPQATSEAVAEA